MTSYVTKAQADRLRERMIGMDLASGPDRTAIVTMKAGVVVHSHELKPLPQSVADAMERLLRRAGDQINADITARYRGEPTRAELKPVRGTARVIR